MMDMLMPVFAIIILVVIIIVVVLVVRSARASDAGAGKAGGLSAKNRNAIVKECSKQLARDPRNVPALTTLGKLYYNEQNWEKAFPLYNSLLELATVHPEIDAASIAERQGICAFKINKFDDSARGLITACKLLPGSFDANYYLGRLMLQKNEYEKAVMCLRKAHSIAPDAIEVNEPLGMAYFKAKHYKESLPILRKALDEDPTNKEVLFTLASAMSETGYNEQALKVFMHLRPDPQYGAQSCLSAGIIHENAKQHESAVQDYEIALKLENVPADLQATIRYRLAMTYLALNNIGKALHYLKQIQLTMPDFKDVGSLIQRYQELNTNANLQAYLMSNASDFVALCRRFVTAYYTDAAVKIEDVSVKPESVEILCTVETTKWEDSELFRFYRSSGATGELYVRDFHSKLRDLKCDRGFCITAGSFTEEAHRYVEGRPVDLIEKSKLTSMLKKI